MPVTAEQVDLALHQAIADACINVDLMDNLVYDAKAYYDPFVRGIIARIKAYIACQKIEDVEIKVPILPRWFTKKYRVKYRTHRYMADALYPQIKLPRARLTPTIRVTHMVGEPEGPQWWPENDDH